MDPCPIQEDIAEAYANYYTHSDLPAAPDVRRRSGSGVVRRLRRVWHSISKRTLRPLRKISEASYRSVIYGDPSAKFAPKWAYPFFYLFPLSRAHTDFSYMFIPVRPGQRLLEIGFGSGAMLTLMNERGWNAEGIDFDEQSVANARARGLNVNAGDVCAQRYPDATFAAIVSSHVVEHLHDPVSFIQECRRILKPGGNLVLITPNADSFGRKLFGSSWFPLDPPRHLLIFTAASLQSTGVKAGFAKGEVILNARDANSIFTGSRNIVLNGHHPWGDIGSRWRQTWTRGLQIVEWGLTCFRPSLGEELIVIFRK
jgi:2-polyprenyl-3-methyl-5-hydroxy-6-metoxy-1,4-benzoquinol methylase